MGALAAVIAQRLECANVFTVPEHVAGALNFDCDALSWLSEGAQLPAILGNVRRDVPKTWKPGFFWGRRAELLAGRQMQSGARGPGASGKRVRTAAVRGPAKRTLALKNKLKGKGKGDQAQQPGAHAVPAGRGQEGQ